jgi:hypothetical protein
MSILFKLKRNKVWKQYNVDEPVKLYADGVKEMLFPNMPILS